MARALRSTRTFAAAGGFMAVDAVLYAIPVGFVTRGLDAVNFPTKHRWIFAPIKAAAAVGLLSVHRFPLLARLTTAMLTLYFALAVGSHVRSRDLGPNAGAAIVFLTLFAAMAAYGPEVSPRRTRRALVHIAVSD